MLADRSYYFTKTIVTRKSNYVRMLVITSNRSETLVFFYFQNYEHSLQYKLDSLLELQSNVNGTRICIDAFKFNDLEHFFMGRGKEQLNMNVKEWTYGQSPLATLIGIFCIFFRFCDTRMANLITHVRGIKLRTYQKVWIPNELSVLY